MRLTSTEQDRLLLFGAAQFARGALERGLLLSAPEAVALLADEVHWAVRDGADHAEAGRRGMTALRPDQVHAGVAEVVDEIRVEALFDEGTRLVVLRWPLGRPDRRAVVAGAAELPFPERERRQVSVVNEGTHVIRVGSHYPFHLVNRRLVFSRTDAVGWHLDLPAGGLERFGPGEHRVVSLVRSSG